MGVPTSSVQDSRFKGICMGVPTSSVQDSRFNCICMGVPTSSVQDSRFDCICMGVPISSSRKASQYHVHVHAIVHDIVSLHVHALVSEGLVHGTTYYTYISSTVLVSLLVLYRLIDTMSWRCMHTASMGRSVQWLPAPAGACLISAYCVAFAFNFAIVYRQGSWAGFGVHLRARCKLIKLVVALFASVLVVHHDHVLQMNVMYTPYIMSL